jgi:membrane dipeptidase
VKAIAASGGVVGISYSRAFLRVRGGPKDAGMVLDHMEHVLKVGGEDAAAIGTDYDGMIVPPPELRDGASYGRLVQKMLDRGWSETRVQNVLGKSFLKSFARLRPSV